MAAAPVNGRQRTVINEKEMKIILNADDFGFDDDTTEATIECFEQGVLSSATIMVNCAASKRAMEYAASHPQFSFGVHLTYVDGLAPTAPTGDIHGLTDGSGKFFPSNYVRKQALLMKLPTSSIINESIAQMQVLEDNGVSTANVDSHGHLHKFPSFLIALKKIQTGIGHANLKVRNVQNIFMTPYKRPASIVPILNSLFRRYIKHNFVTTDYFYMAANNFDTDWSENILRQLDTLDDNATIEIGIHPGHKEEWRQHEFDDIHHFALLLKSTKHKVINWNNI